jgi:uncharacterized protein (TIGR00645 family)
LNVPELLIFLAALKSLYENFVLQLKIKNKDTHLNWLGSMDANSLKLKGAASIVAISSIHLLRIFMDAKNILNDKIIWYIIMHLTFVVSAFMMGYRDKIIKH